MCGSMHLDIRASTFDADGVPFPALRVRPAISDSLPMVLLIHEVWGVDPHIQDVTARLATAGYDVFAPDLWSAGGHRPAPLSQARMDEARAFLVGMGPGVWAEDTARREAIAREPEPLRARLQETVPLLFGARPDDRRLFLERSTATLSAAVKHLRAEDPARPLLSVGFCVGGDLCARLACTEPLDGGVIFYGPPPPESMLATLSCPLLGFYGEKDNRITDAVPAFAATLARLGKSFEHHIFPGARHAFFNDTGRGYQATAARFAWARTLTFLAERSAAAAG
jgi:carboxymethylenebutenolidase